MTNINWLTALVLFFSTFNNVQQPNVQDPTVVPISDTTMFCQPFPECEIEQQESYGD